MALGSNLPQLGAWMWTKEEHPNIPSGRSIINWFCGLKVWKVFKSVLFPNTRVGILLMRNEAVRMTSLHKYFGTLAMNMKDLTTSSKFWQPHFVVVY